MDGETRAYFEMLRNKIDSLKEQTTDIKKRLDKISDKYVTKEYCQAISRKKNLFDLSDRQVTIICSTITGILSMILGYNIS